MYPMIYILTSPCANTFYLISRPLAGAEISRATKHEIDKTWLRIEGPNQTELLLRVFLSTVFLGRFGLKPSVSFGTKHAQNTQLLGPPRGAKLHPPKQNTRFFNFRRDSDPGRSTERGLFGAPFRLRRS